MLKEERTDDCMVAMEWQPEGKRVGRAKTTRRRAVEKESRQKRWTSWAEVRDTAQDRAGLIGERKLELCAFMARRERTNELKN